MQCGTSVINRLWHHWTLESPPLLHLGVSAGQAIIQGDIYTLICIIDSIKKGRNPVKHMDIKKTIASSNWWLELMADSIRMGITTCIICSAAQWELIRLRAVADTAFQADIMDKMVI